MARISKLTYQKVKNLGNYETERVEAEATVEPGEDPVRILAKLKAFVEKALEEK